ncbi:MAG: hypothetical protein HY835_14890, partial [Anaerolineae bacterium]|nr:hypothetical protein [Anaerolineae bacterium]
MTCEAVLRMISLDLPVIAGAGIYSQEQAELLLRLGASAVQLDAVLWRGAVPGTLEDNPPDQASSQMVTGPSL